MSEEPKSNKHHVYELEKLAQVRDELRLQAHLFKADMRDEWETLEKKWDELNQRVQPLRHASDETADDLSTAGRLLFDSVRDGYHRLRDAVKHLR